MTWRILLIAFVAIGGYVGWVFLDDWVAMQAWASWIDNKWELTGRGWDSLAFTWPVGVAGIIIGLIISPIADLLVDTAERQDHRETVQDLKKQAEAAENQADKKYADLFEEKNIQLNSKIKKIKEELREEEECLRNRLVFVEERESESNYRAEALDIAITSFNSERACLLEKNKEAEEEKEKAYQRSKNSRAAAERYKRKAERYKQESEKYKQESEKYKRQIEEMQHQATTSP